MQIRAIITGVTGMVGEGVLHECLADKDVEEVLIVNRKPSGVSHPKLKEIIHENFFDLSPIRHELRHYNACYFCLGVSSVGMNEADYNHVTFDLTMHFAETVSSLNNDMVFCYVSGAGTDSTEAGRSMWARVKGKTENHLMILPFKKVYAFRPGYLHPTKGLVHTNKFYAAFSFLYPVLKRFFPKYACTLKELGQAMINVTIFGYHKNILDPTDIVALARRREV